MTAQHEPDLADGATFADPFERRDAARVLADGLAAAAGVGPVALCGPAGSGKSSMVALARGLLERDPHGAPFVVAAPWLAPVASPAELDRAVSEAVLAAIGRTGSGPAVAGAARAWTEWRAALAAAARPPAAALPSLATVGGTLLAATGWAAAAIKGSPVFWLPVLAVVGGLVYRTTAGRIPFRRGATPEPDRAAARFGAAVGELPARLAIVMDDADRLASTELAALLRFAARLGAIPNVSVLVVGSRDGLLGALGSGHGRAGAETLFASAVVGVFDVPPPPAATLSAFAAERIGAAAAGAQGDDVALVATLVLQAGDADRIARQLRAFPPPASVSGRPLRAGDALALEALRALEPGLFAALPGAMALLTGLDWAGGRTGGATAAGLAALAAVAAPGRREAVGALLRALFPPVTWDDSWHPDEDPDAWLDQGRICHPTVFAAYFRVRGAASDGRAPGVE